MMRDCLVPLLERHWREFDGPFQWGVRDCGLFAARWVETVTKRDILASLPPWADEAGAQAALASRGWADMRDAANAHLEPRTVSFARLGDVVARQFPTGWTLGVCMGARGVAFLDIRHGLCTLALNRCGAAWAVDPA